MIKVLWISDKCFFLIITYYDFYGIDTDYVHTKLRNVETFMWVFYSRH